MTLREVLCTLPGEAPARSALPILDAAQPPGWPYGPVMRVTPRLASDIRPYIRDYFRGTLSDLVAEIGRQHPKFTWC